MKSNKISSKVNSILLAQIFFGWNINNVKCNNMKTIWSVKFFAPCTSANEFKLSYFSYHDDEDASLGQWKPMPDSFRVYVLPGVYLCVVLIKCEMLRPLSGLSNWRKDQNKYKDYFHSRKWTLDGWQHGLFLSLDLLLRSTWTFCRCSEQRALSPSWWNVL